MTLGSHCLPNRTVGALGLQKHFFTLEGNEPKLEIARFKGANSRGLLMTLLTSGLQSLAWEVRDHTLPHTHVLLLRPDGQPKSHVFITVDRGAQRLRDEPVPRRPAPQGHIAGQWWHRGAQPGLSGCSPRVLSATLSWGTGNYWTS